MSTSLYLTTPIYYVNSTPHLGTAYTTIAADALARYRRMTGSDVVFLTGLDEHGQKVAEAAEAAGVTPQEWVDAIAPKFLETWRGLDISNDRFIRTTDPAHQRGARRLMQAIYDAGHIYRGHYEGWYCVPDETFFTEDQLVDGRCPDCGRDVQLVREDNWFFRLSAFQDALLAHYEAAPEFVRPETRRNEVLSFVAGGLNDVSISRTAFTWGIPLPFDPEHVMYVWFDALINYLTAVGYGGDTPEEAADFERYWPADVHFVGKDIIRFHCVIWPAMLMAAGIALPKQVFAHGFLLAQGGEKMGKSRGNVMAPADLVERFGVDAYRYYFLRDVQFGTDGSVSVDSMVRRYNGDLANDWGNLCSRLFNMTEKYLGGVVPDRPTGLATREDEELMTIARELPAAFEAAMARLDYAGALGAVWELVKRVNRYIEECAPWNLARSEELRPRLESVLYDALEAVRIAALFIAPVMPRTSAEVWRRLGIAEEITTVTDIAATAAWAGLEPGLRVFKGEPLFPRIIADDDSEGG
jgi:methionyl-tRNA synthetase